jgi:DNA-binding IclR family transcriptional regulator
VKDLVEAGFLQKVAAGRYALGARIIELDYRLRRSDPVLLAAAPVMEELVRRTRLDAVLTAMFGAKVVDKHRVSGDAALELQYGRGRPRPLFQGSAPKVILACLPRAQLVRLHAQHADEIAAHGLGASWAEFRDRMAAIRREGFYLSLGELEPGVGAAAVPLLGEDGAVLAALALVGTVERLQAMGAPRLQAVLGRAAVQVREAMAGER